MWGLHDGRLPKLDSRNSFRARVGLTLVDLRKTPVRKSILSG